MRPPNLPDFAKPPVSEVALGVQFAPLEGFRSIHAALVWKTFQKNFPKYIEQPPLDPVFEIIGTPQQKASEFRLSFQAQPPLPRLWFLKEDETQLVQFQIDRLLHNWRKVAVDDVYPRYERIRDEFVSEIEQVEKLVRQHDLGSIEVNQCEVTYVNHITKSAAAIGDALKFIQTEGLVTSQGAPEGVAAHVRYILRDPDDNAKPIGRLTLVAQPAQLADGEPILSVTLTARGSPRGAGFEGAIRFLDLGREAIVKTFAEVTTPLMQEIWGRTQ